MEWVEAQAPSVENAVAAALQELGIASPEQAEIEVIQEPKTGFLGMGGQDAIVKVTRKPTPKRRRRRRRGSGGESSTSDSKPAGGDRRGDKPAPKPAPKRTSQAKSAPKGAAPTRAKEKAVEAGNDQQFSIEDQAGVAKEFLVGLLDAFGLEGDVTTNVDDEILLLDVSGPQTEALVGSKGSIMYAVLELTRTVVQRKTFGAPRMRIDVAGYGERRREALRIYTGKLADKVIEGGGEIMLEPMNAADRKVVHDAVADLDGVRSYSEGEDPNRSVVIAPVEAAAAE